MKKVILIILCLFMLCGCSKEPKCIKQHTERVRRFIPTGKGIILIYSNVSICDEYENNTIGD